MGHKQYHILIIDDNEDILFMIKAVLQMKGYAVSAKEDFQDIELVIEAAQPDLILMDMLLCGADGRQVCSRIKSNNSISGIPLIMITALPGAEASCINAGADFFLSKPFEMADLLRTIKNVLPSAN